MPEPPETSTSVIVVQGPDGLKHTPRYQQLRVAYGGKYPMVVVHSKKPYVIIGQDGDVLVYGCHSPKRVRVDDRPDWVLDQRDGQRVIRPTSKAPVRVVYVKDRLEPGVELPPLCPPGLLRKQDIYDFYGSRVEPAWVPDQQIASYKGTAEALSGERVEVYQVVLP